MRKHYQVITANDFIPIFETNNIRSAWIRVDKKWKKDKQSCLIINRKEKTFEYKAEI